MGYNYELERAAGSEILLIPDDPLVQAVEVYPIEPPDMAKMIELYFYEINHKFTENDLITALELFDAHKSAKKDIQAVIRQLKSA